MHKRLGSHVRQNVIGYIALFFALSGGVAWATHPGGANTISSGDIQDNQVFSADVRNDTLSGGGLGAVDLRPGSVGTSEVVNNSLTGADINESSLGIVPNADKLDGISSAGFWKLGGNVGTSGSDFLGTTDLQSLSLRVNNARGLRLEPASDGTNQSPNLIGGIADNTATAGVHSATIAGGGRLAPSVPTSANRVTDHQGTVGGGANNQAGNGNGTVGDATLATVAGGGSNTASGDRAVVGGGLQNTASGSYATVTGGLNNGASGLAAAVSGIGNTASGDAATVAGGNSNTASGYAAAVPNGDTNTALGDYSLAAGRRAKANHQGSFVWADSHNLDFASVAADDFSVRSTGGARFVSAIDGTGAPTAGVTLASGGGSWASLSDQASKTAITPVSGRAVLRKLGSVPVSEWSYRAQGPSIRHIGPMAQDLRRAFGVGEDSRHITSVDADGISLAAIKGLNEKVRALQRRGGAPAVDTAGSSNGFPLPFWALAALAAIGLTAAAALGAALALRWQGALRDSPATG
jgi:hypothetical protein